MEAMVVITRNPSIQWDTVYTWERGERVVERNGAGPLT